MMKSPNPFSLFFTGKVFQPTDHLHDSPLHLLQQVQCSYGGDPRAGTALPEGSQQSTREVRIIYLDLLLTLVLMQHRTVLAFWAARAHCQVMLDFSSAKTLNRFSSGLPSVYFPPSLYLCLGLPWQRGKTFTGPTSQSYPGPSGWCPFPLTSWLHHTAGWHQ